MPKKVLVAFPAGMLEMIDFVAEVEHRTRSDLIREALRRYLSNFQRANGTVPQLAVITTQPKEKNDAVRTPARSDSFFTHDIPGPVERRAEDGSDKSEGESTNGFYSGPIIG